MSRLSLGFLKIFLLILFLAPLASSAQTGPFDYAPLEKIPGFETETTGDFYQYIQAVYNFGLWAVGIAALLMITIGGYMYITSAGNTASMGKAKGVITDALIGLVLALGAYLLLYVINPDLVNIKKLPTIGTTPGTGLPSVTPPGTTRAGTCSPVTSGSCSVSHLQATCFGANAEKLSKICSVESGGDPSAISKTDKCKDGNLFSIGLFQINMINSAGPVCNGADIFEVNGSGPQGTCLEPTTNSNGVKYCAKWDCRVKDPAKYAACLAKLQNSQTNIQLACGLCSNGASLSPWRITAQWCGL